VFQFFRKCSSDNAWSARNHNSPRVKISRAAAIEAPDPFPPPLVGVRRRLAASRSMQMKSQIGPTSMHLRRHSENRAIPTSINPPPPPPASCQRGSLNASHLIHDRSSHPANQSDAFRHRVCLTEQNKSSATSPLTRDDESQTAGKSGVVSPDKNFFPKRFCITPWLISLQSAFPLAFETAIN